MKFALRQLLKSPAFTAVAVLSLALGIGANTVIFSLVNEVLLRSLPVKNPDELVIFRVVQGARGRINRSTSGNSYTDPATGRLTTTSFPVLALERMRAVSPSPMTAVFGFTPLHGAHVLVEGEPELNPSVQLISGNYHTSLGVSSVLGRMFSAEQDRADTEPVAVISERFWQTRFGRDPAVLGKIVQVNRVPATIIGVTPPGFAGAGQVGDSPDISVPLALFARFTPERAADNAQPWSWWIRIMGRLAPGAPPEQAVAVLEPVFQQVAREGWQIGQSANQSPNTEIPDLPTLAVDPGAQGENDTRRHFGKSVRILMGLVSLVLLAACANVANLLLARGASRRREIAVRLALGASRGRLVRQLLAESLLLAACGSALGIAFAWWGRELLIALRPFGTSSFVMELPLDWSVLGFTVGVAATTALLFGLAPALRATRIDLIAEFQGGQRALGAGARSRLSQGLMVVQIALSLVLLVSTGLFIRTLRNLQNVDPGFNRHSLVLFQINAGSAGYTRERAGPLQLRLAERLAQIPGVRAATYADVALLSRGRSSRGFSTPGHTLPTGAPTSVNVNGVAPNFFEAMQIPLVLGRAFTERDDASAPKVAIVNQEFVKKIYGGENPIGRRFQWGSGTPNPAHQLEIVGVARDAAYNELRSAIAPVVYTPIRQQPSGVTNYTLRLSGDPGTVFPAIRAAAREIDPALPVLNLRTQDEQIDRLNAQELLFARLSGFFGLLALALACVGLYGLMSYGVVRRTGEIGLRMALGALPAQVMRMILRESLALICAGVVLGLAGAYAASRLIATMLFGVKPNDPLTYAAVALILIGVALLAALLPARRAAKVEPMQALRTE